MVGRTFELLEATATTTLEAKCGDYDGTSGDDVPAGTLKSVQKAAGLEKNQ